MTALLVPRNMEVRLTALPAARLAVGVAEEIPSTAKVFMIRPKLISRKQRPASAGLIKFLPRPPKQHFATTIANTEPIIGIYSGREGLRLRASSRPVTTALPSQMVEGLWAILLKSHSLSTAATMLTATMAAACQP